MNGIEKRFRKRDPNLDTGLIDSKKLLTIVALYSLQELLTVPEGNNEISPSLVILYVIICG